MFEEAKNVADPPLVPESTMPKVDVFNLDQQNQQPAERGKTLYEALFTWRVIMTFLFMLTFYFVPLSLTSFILPRETDTYIPSNIEGYELYPLDGWFLSYVGYKGNIHAFVGFRFAYMACLYFNSRLVALMTEVITHAMKK